MQALQGLTADDLVSVMTTYRDLLRAHREQINLLNVYPVPDGDTGTNMALTIDSVVQEILSRPPGATVTPTPSDGSEHLTFSEVDHAVPPRELRSVSEAISHGSLMGARGNSGVILSQILRGLAGAFADAAAGGNPEIDGAVLVDGLRRATDGAYSSVGNPVEGTILTVVRAASESAAAAMTGDVAGPSLLSVLDAAREGAAVALAATPDMLPVLKSAGVVDSGGTGLVLLFDAALHVVGGRPLPEAESLVGRTGPTAPLADPSAPGRATHSSEAAGLRYEVMYLLEASEGSIAEFRRVWAGVGDSIVVVGDDGLYNCHIHTDDIGAAVEAALDAGRPREIRVSDLWDQVEEERWVREAGVRAIPEEEPEPVGCAVVAVCSGEGIRRIFHSLGVGTTVSGGQSMNPSTAEILAAIEDAPSGDVIVLPNNKNIVPVALAAAEQSPKSVRVVATVGIPDGFAALMEYDPESDAASNAVAMTASAARVVSGEVTRAVRDAEGPDGPITVGDWIGLMRSGIEVVADHQADAAIGLLDRLIDGDHHEIATIIVGEGATPAETRRVTEWLAEHWPALGIEVHQGGQPLYPYLISIE